MMMWDDVRWYDMKWNVQHRVVYKKVSFVKNMKICVNFGVKHENLCNIKEVMCCEKMWNAKCNVSNIGFG
jgi:hypothetical protein